MRSSNHSVLFLGLLISFAGPISGQIIRTPPIIGRGPLPRDLPSQAIIVDDDDDRSGPRLGVAYLLGGSVTAEREGVSIAPVMSLFGWQVEHQFPTGDKSAPIPMTELVLLLGGMEQGRALPSVSWMLGLRQRNGWEGGLGPTVTGAGVQMAFAAGRTQSLGSINVPVNLAVAPGRRGASISVTTGFNVKRHGR